MKEIPHIELPEMYNEHEFIDSPLVKIPDNSVMHDHYGSGKSKCQGTGNYN